MIYCPLQGKHDDSFALAHFRKHRFNRILRQYENVWAWRDINIGPHGRYVFTLDVPAAPAHWTLSAFAMSPSGLGMLVKPITVGTLFVFALFIILIYLKSESQSIVQIYLVLFLFHFFKYF